jgi:hypothetical protein
LQNSKEKVVVFGTGKASKVFLKKNKSKFHILAFFDNNLSVCSFKGFSVLPPQSLESFEFDKIVIASMYFVEIREQLISEQGIPDEKIVSYASFMATKPNLIQRFIKDLYKLHIFFKSLSLDFFGIFCSSLFPEKFKKIIWFDELHSKCKYESVLLEPNDFENIYFPCGVKEKRQASSIGFIPEVRLFKLNNILVSPISRSFFYKNFLVAERLSGLNYFSQIKVDYSSNLLDFHGGRYSYVNKNYPTVIIEKGIFVPTVAENNYYHWLIEAVPRLMAIKNLSGPYKSYPVLLSSFFKKIPSIEKVISLLGLDNIIIPLDSNKLYLVKDSIVFGSVNFNINDYKYGCFQINEQSLFYRKNYLEGLKKLVFSNMKIKENPTSIQRIFLARKQHLRAYNQDEVFDLFAPFGFEMVYLEDISFQEQLSLMHSVQYIVGPSGAAWTNLLFLGQADVKGLCWMHKRSQYNPCFSQLAAYFGCNLQSIFFGDKGLSDEAYSANYRIELIELNQMKKWIEKELL